MCDPVTAENAVDAKTASEPHFWKQLADAIRTAGYIVSVQRSDMLPYLVVNYAGQQIINNIKDSTSYEFPIKLLAEDIPGEGIQYIFFNPEEVDEQKAPKLLLKVVEQWRRAKR